MGKALLEGALRLDPSGPGPRGLGNCTHHKFPDARRYLSWTSVVAFGPCPRIRWGCCERNQTCLSLRGWGHAEQGCAKSRAGRVPPAVWGIPCGPFPARKPLVITSNSGRPWAPAMSLRPLVQLMADGASQWVAVVMHSMDRPFAALHWPPLFQSPSCPAHICPTRTSAHTATAPGASDCDPSLSPLICVVGPFSVLLPLLACPQEPGCRCPDGGGRHSVLTLPGNTVFHRSVDGHAALGALTSDDAGSGSCELQRCSAPSAPSFGTVVGSSLPAMAVAPRCNTSTEEPATGIKPHARPCCDAVVRSTWVATLEGGKESLSPSPSCHPFKYGPEASVKL